MKHPLPSLDRLKVFESSARLLSFTKAATELCITKGAVSYQIKRLEDQIGVPLFRRSTRQIFLTDAGQSLFQTTRSVFDEVEGSIQRIRASKRHDVTIAATTYVAARWLSPRVAKFLEQYPDMSVRFEHHVNDPSFQLKQTDLALIWGHCQHTTDQHTIANIPMPLFPAVNPGQAARLAEDKTWINKITLLSEDRSQDLWLEWFGKKVLPNPRQVIEDANVRVQAAIDGQGMILADDLMKNELDSQMLIAPFDHVLSDYGYLLKRNADTAASLAVNSILKWLLSD